VLEALGEYSMLNPQADSGKGCQMQLSRAYRIFVVGCIVGGLGILPSLAMAAAITSLSANASAVGKYEKFELTFNLASVSPSNFNPFRPETSGDALSPAGVDVRAEVVTPSGAVHTVSGFYDADFMYLGNSTSYLNYDRLVPISGPHWHVRYAPMEPGQHRVTVKVTDASGTATSAQQTFTCIESGKHGFVRVSDDGARLVYSDGAPFIPFGTMAPYGTANAMRGIAAMKANGMNFIRRWLVDRDFDDIYRNFEAWSSTSYDSAVYRSGKRSAVKTVTGAGTLVDDSFIGCKPNTYYKAFIYLKTSSSFNGEAAVNVNEDSSSVSTVSRTGNRIGSNQNWALSQVVFKTGSTAEMLHFKPKILSGTSGTVWADDAGLYECDSAGSVTVNYNMVQNPSFEEWTPARLRMLALARFEYLLQQCEANGIVVQPAIFNYRLWNKTSPTGFYAQHFGDWWTDAASIAQQDRVLRYVVARFGHYRSLFAWELTNEMDASYTEVRRAWIAGRARFIRRYDPYRHPITNSHWTSPPDYEYGQMNDLDLNQVHYYMNTEERITGQGYPTWWTISSGMSVDTNPSNAASGSKSLKAVANGGTIEEDGPVYCKPSRSYTLRYKVKTSGVTGQASLVVRLDGGTSPGSGFTLSNSGSIAYTTRTQTFTTGSTAVRFTVNPQLTGSAGTAWWDDVEVIDNATGLSVLYNGGFECAPLGDDEFEWALNRTIRSRQMYEGGPNGTGKPWGSGEFGLMGANADISKWALYTDTTKPRHDTTGIHVHNGVWAQLMASSALNTPTYWWMGEYIQPYGLWSAWKGAASLAAALPFYDRGQTISTEDGAEVRCSSSDSRIRLLGQKKASSAYLWMQNRGNTWSKVVRDGVNPSAVSATLTVPGLQDGAYTVNWHDTYTGSVLRTESKNVLQGKLELSVASLSKDVAAIVKKQEQTAQVPQIALTLSADKATALPSQVVAYTIRYTNTGTADASNVEIVLPVPAHTTYVAGSASMGGTYDAAGNSVKWTVPVVPPGTSGICTAQVKIQ
jgi:uncharacterized repeat protein (TIGR01451 family)